MLEAAPSVDLLRSESDPVEQDQSLRERWLAVYTKSRHEKILNQELAKKGIAGFLPLRKIVRHWSDRKKVIEEPLFKSYLFVHIPWVKRWQVLNSVGAVSFVGMRQGMASEIPVKEIETVRKFVDGEIQMDPFPYLRAGERVYVRSGPFKGAEGFVVHKNNQCRLVISLDLLMQSISIEIDEACVELIG